MSTNWVSVKVSAGYPCPIMHPLPSAFLPFAAPRALRLRLAASIDIFECSRSEPLANHINKDFGDLWGCARRSRKTPVWSAAGIKRGDSFLAQLSSRLQLRSGASAHYSARSVCSYVSANSFCFYSARSQRVHDLGSLRFEAGVFEPVRGRISAPRVLALSRGPSRVRDGGTSRFTRQLVTRASNGKPAPPDRRPIPLIS